VAALTSHGDYYTLKMRSWYDPQSLNADDLAKLNSAREEIAKNDQRTAEFKAMEKAIETEAQRPQTAGRPGFKPRIELLEQGLAAQLATVKNLTAKLQTLQGEYDAYKTKYSEKTFAQYVAEQRQKDAAERQAMQTALKEATDKHQEQLTAVAKDAELKTTDAIKRAAEAEKRANERISQELAKLDQERAEQMQKFQSRQIVQFDQPRGRVLNFNPGDQTVSIDVGSDQRVTPQLSFLVYGRGPGGKPQPEPKAKIEVISVQGKRQSLARVTQVAKPEAARPANVDSTSDEFWIKDSRLFYRARNPILTGDLIYNPAWDPNQRVHVALAGIFDLNSDGQDDVEVLRRLLQERGAEVDAYLDPKEGYQLRGKIDQQTQYLIVGTEPITGRVGKATDPAGEAKDPYTALQEEARRRGIQIVQVKEFLTRMGFSDMRLPTFRSNAAPSANGPNGGIRPNGQNVPQRDQ
jgi:hypothetical protein